MAEFQVWARDTTYVVQGVRIEDDTLTGVVIGPAGATSSDIAIAMTEVDSIRAARSVNAMHWGVVYGLLLVGGAIYLVLGSHGN